MQGKYNALPAVLVIVAVVTSVWALARGGGDYDVSWYTVDAGGGTFSTGGGYELGATIGQSDAGPVMSGGDYTLRGGFWPGAAVVPAPAGPTLTAAA